MVEYCAKQKIWHSTAIDFCREKTFNTKPLHGFVEEQSLSLGMATYRQHKTKVFYNK